LEQAVIDAPTDPEAYVIMGDLAVRERRFTESRMLYQKAADLAAKFTGSTKRKDLLQPRILGGLASIDEVQENWADARKQLEAWLKLEPKNALAMQRLANCLFHQKDADGALKKLKEAAKADPEVLTPEAILGQFYEQANDRENAKKWMAAALQAAPNDLRTHLIVGQWALETNQMPEAEAQAAAALKVDPKSLDAKILSGVIALFKKDYSAAERYFEAAHLQSPRNFASTNNLALVLVEQTDEAKKRRALEYAQSNVQQNPRSAEAASTYGWVLYKLGRLDEAEKAFQAAVAGGSVGADTAYYIARLSYDRGRETQAKQWLDIALRSTGPFAMRQDATALMEKLKK
jgi:tetratricopeptide (TPR) repeat protein